MKRSILAFAILMAACGPDKSRLVKESVTGTAICKTYDFGQGIYFVECGNAEEYGKALSELRKAKRIISIAPLVTSALDVADTRGYYVVTEYTGN